MTVQTTKCAGVDGCSPLGDRGSAPDENGLALSGHRTDAGHVRKDEAVHETVDVVAVDLLGGHRVRLTFDDGHVVERDLYRLMWGPVFDCIRKDPTEFEKVSVDVELGILTWPNGADIDAELLRYDDLWRQREA